MILGKLNSVLDILRTLRCHDEGCHPFLLKVSIVEELVGSHAGQPSAVIVIRSRHEGISVTLRVRDLIEATGGAARQPAVRASNKASVVQTGGLIVGGRIFEINKFVQTKTTLTRSIDQSSKFLYLSGGWPVLISWLTVFLG